MKHKILFIILLLSSQLSISQIVDTYVDDENLIKPTIEVSAGQLFYGGELSSKSYRNPFLSRAAFRIGMSSNVTDYLNVSVTGMFGKVEGNERSATRNLNFQSRISIFTLQFNYNFHHILPIKRNVEPYIGIGLGTINYISKTDIVNSEGFTYHYWDDGSIRNLAQNSPFANEAIRLRRDYIYESDIRELNVDGLGRYPEFSLAIPMSAGIQWRISPHIRFKLGASYIYTLTDYIDGITLNSKGIRQGNRAKDFLVYTEAGLAINLNWSFAMRKLKRRYTNIDFAKVWKQDTDGDGVLDAKDLCAGTPPSVVVDAKGCPIDSDGDGVPDYIDLEINSTPGAIVNSDGVALSDAELERYYTVYMDTLPGEGKIIREKISADIMYRNKPSYRVVLAETDKAVPADVMNLLLSVKDVKTEKVGDKTIYYVGNYTNNFEADNKKKEMIAFGLTDAKVMQFKGGKYIPVSGLAGDIVSDSFERTGDGKRVKTKKGYMYLSTENDPAGQVIFRTQIGAYSKEVNPDFFGALSGQVIIFKTSNGLFKYYIGQFTDYGQAAKHKIDMIASGFEGAFTVAFKDGKPQKLQDVGATPTMVVSDINQLNITNKELIRFKVQLASFNRMPDDKQKEKFNKVETINFETSNNGIVRVTAGEFKSYEDAASLKIKLANEGFNDAFIVPFYDGKRVTFRDIQEIYKR